MYMYSGLTGLPNEGEVCIPICIPICVRISIYHAQALAALEHLRQVGRHKPYPEPEPELQP